NASPAIREGCEEALFANAETIANALSLTTMRLSLLREEVARAETNSNFEPLLAALREPLEADPYGFVAHALEVRFACTAEQCSMFPLLSDHRKVQENLRENAFEKKIAALKAAPAHRSTEPRKEPQTEPETQPGAPHGAAPQASLPSQPKPLPPNFTLPSSDTIPPVSIMDPEPAPAAGSSGRSAGTPAPAPRPQNRGSTREPPMQLVPPTRRP
ncbi:MAG: hypothetical protein J0H62_01455, partial [Rhizobiales bacterium]|nr:hypothetical protein [Hyphomicrobiales bacterium]